MSFQVFLLSKLKKIILLIIYHNHWCTFDVLREGESPADTATDLISKLYSSLLCGCGFSPSPKLHISKLNLMSQGSKSTRRIRIVPSFTHWTVQGQDKIEIM